MTGENGLRRINARELLAQPALELVINDKVYQVSPMRVGQALNFEAKDQERYEDTDIIYLVLADQGITREEIEALPVAERRLNAKAIMAVFFSDPPEMLQIEGMDRVNLIYSTGLGLSLASYAPTPATRSRGSSRSRSGSS